MNDFLNYIPDDFQVLEWISLKEQSAVARVQGRKDGAWRVLKLKKTADAEAGLLAELKHPGIVQLEGVRDMGGVQCLILENLVGGSLDEQLEYGLPVQFLWTALNQICSALGRIHELEYIHGDLKPEHVLFSLNGGVRLIDLHAARPFHTLTDQKALVASRPDSGTLEYLAPERLSGDASDGRADFYSLGVMIFHLLSGRLPFESSDREKILQMHLHDPIPRLPLHFSKQQPLVNGLMAKRPADRFANADAVCQALEDCAPDDLQASIAIRSAAIVTDEILRISDQLRSLPGERQQIQRRLRRKRRRRQALQVTGVGLALLLATGTAFLVRDAWMPTVSAVALELGIIEDRQLNQAWNEADSLRQDPNQSLATIYGAYQRVLVLSPDNAAARQAIQTLAQDWKASIEDALQKDDLSLAESRLLEANQVLGEDPILMVLSLRLQNRFRAERLLASTRTLLAENGLSDLPSAAAALQAYQEIMRIAPRHPGAEAGLQEIAEHYSQLAADAALAGEVNLAIMLLERATAANNELRDLDRVRQLISEATSIQSALAELLDNARRLRAEGRTLTPPGANAAELYQQVLATDPDNATAAQGLEELVSQTRMQIQEALGVNNMRQAESLLEQAVSVGLAASSVALMRASIDSEKQRLALIEAMLSRSRGLLAEGFITQPADNNATSLLREILALESDHSEAKALLLQAARRLVEVAREARRAGLATQADEYLGLALALFPERGEWIQLRAEWRDEADERDTVGLR